VCFILIRLCIITGDISPIDVIAHLPILCEEKEVPYIYIPSREVLGIACLTKRPTSTVLLCPDKKNPYYSKYLKLRETVKAQNPYF
jgi:ribosomal protein L7Ae-like RNA K-turn-binding protein